MSGLPPIDQDTQRFRDRLQRAVQSEAMPPYLESRVRHSIRDSRPSNVWLRRLVPAGVFAGVCVGAIIAYQLGHLRLTTSSQESYIASVSNRVGTLMRVGLGDHIHCSVFRKFPKNPPNVEDLVKSMNPQYRGLVDLMRDKVPARYRLWIAHECRYHGRRFVHLSMSDGSRLLSLVIARRGDGESFEIENMLPALVQSGIPVYRAGVQRFEIAAFESRDHLVYFISDMPKQQNLDMTAALAPDVKGFLAKLEI